MLLTTFVMLAAIVYFFILPTTNDRIIPVRKIVMMPAVFIYFFFSTGTKYFQWDNTNKYLAAAGMVMGVIFGILLRARTQISTDKNRRLIALPGSYANLMIFVFIFGLHFILAYLQAVNPGWAVTLPEEKNILLLLLAWASALNTGMSLCLFYKYYIDRNQTLMLVS